jgi:ferredoxin--NADP+ reductase
MSEIRLPEVELNIYNKKDPFEATVAENYVVTKESSPNFIRHITFDISGSDLVGRVKVGQSIGVLPPGEDENGKPHKLRLYSVSSPSEGEHGKAHLISTTVKRAIDEIPEHKLYLGVCSNYLSDLNVGDKVLLTGPSGKRFLLPENKEDYNYVFFATGTGIAPFRGMLMELFNDDYHNEVALIFGCPYRTDLLYPDYLQGLKEAHPNFHYITCISRENRRADGSKYYVQTALEDRSEELLPILKKENTLIYICGLKGMQAGIYHSLAKMGLNEYLIVKDPLTSIPPEEWKYQDISKAIKPSARTFEEVY